MLELSTDALRPCHLQHARVSTKTRIYTPPAEKPHNLGFRLGSKMLIHETADRLDPFGPILMTRGLFSSISLRDSLLRIAGTHVNYLSPAVPLAFRI